MGGFVVPGGAAAFGGTAYAPLSDAVHSPGTGGDLSIMGLAIAASGAIFGAVVMITTLASTPPVESHVTDVPPHRRLRCMTVHCSLRRPSNE
jgi:heme/copper-type cytochrome/quinol oxidase subunit 1